MRRRAQAGFTLIELVLAVTLLAGMLAMAWGGLGYALRAWEAGDANGHRAADLRLSENFLRRELSEMFPMRWKDPMTLKFAFDGQKQSMRFASVRPPGISAPGLSLVSLELIPGAAGRRTKDLVMRRAPPDDEAKDFAPLERADGTVLVPEVEAVEFGYFGAENDLNEPRWTDTWPYPGRMPLLVRLRVVTADGDRLPEIVARPMLGEEAGCLENAFQRVCRPRRPA